MDGIEYNLQGLIDKAAFEHLKSKRKFARIQSFTMSGCINSLAFTVAKMMDADSSPKSRNAIESAQQNGAAFCRF